MKKKEIKNKLNNKNDLELHSERFVQYYGMPIPSLLEKYLKLSKYYSILDCGCGDGVLLEALKLKGYLKGKQVHAIDLSKRRIVNVKKLDKLINARIDSAEDLNTIKNKSIDFFISTQVIEHVDDKKMLSTIQRVLKKNGIAYVSTVYKKWYGWYFYRRDGRWVMDPTHIREYANDKQLLSLIDKKQFFIIETDKQLLWFPLMDFFLRRFSVSDNKFFVQNMFFKQIRKISIPIIGYYNWDIILKRK